MSEKTGKDQQDISKHTGGLLALALAQMPSKLLPLQRSLMEVGRTLSIAFCGSSESELS